MIGLCGRFALSGMIWIGELFLTIPSHMATIMDGLVTSVALVLDDDSLGSYSSLTPQGTRLISECRRPSVVQEGDGGSFIL